MKSTFDNLEVAVKKSLQEWHKADTSTSPLRQLYLFRAPQFAHLSNARQTTNHILLGALETLKESYPQEALLIQKRFLDLLPVNQVANELNIADSTLYVLQRKGIERLTGIIRNAEAEYATRHKSALFLRLESPSYAQLIGIEEQLATLLQLIQGENPPWIIAIEGIGGLGKTALADRLMRCVVQKGLYDEIGWVSARQTTLQLDGHLHTPTRPALDAAALIEQLFYQMLPTGEPNAASQESRLSRLREHLKQKPGLIVIDNLETVHDVQSLLPSLQDFANPTRFILTSRYNLYSEPNIYHFAVPELSQEDTKTLVRQEAALSNLPVLATAADAELACIYDTVGGNPLAIRLVVGQVHVHPLRHIVSNLRQVKGEPTENLYGYIYRQAWESLDELGKRILLAMPLAPPAGDDLNFIAAISEIDIDELARGLNQLVARNLVDARGGLNQRRYSIHGLTRTFLHKQVLGWMQ